MTKEQTLKLSGYQLFQCQIKALREKTITFRQLKATSELWLRHRGYVRSGLGWWKPAELAAMGAVCDETGHWALATEECHRVVGQGSKQEVQALKLPVRAAAFFVTRQKDNARFAGLLRATQGQE